MQVVWSETDINQPLFNLEPFQLPFMTSRVKSRDIVKYSQVNLLHPLLLMEQTLGVNHNIID